MHISRIEIENVKSFIGKHAITLCNGVNYFVGDNNSGKSTVLQSLLFLFEGPSTTRWTPETFYSRDSDGPTRVTVEIQGDLTRVREDEKFAVLAPYVFEKDGQETLRIERSSETRKIYQNGKEKSADVKTLCLWRNSEGRYENPTGIDARTRSLFDFEAVWADASPGDHIDFASNKTLGRILDAQFKKFAETDQWTNLVQAHNEAFSATQNGSFYESLDSLSDELKAVVDDQYGKAHYRFAFELPEPTAFLKQGSLHVDDGTGETPITGKGTGMQRAVALGLIQVYARSKKQSGDNPDTPLILMLDEPETWLHPSAQMRLGDAVDKIGKSDQVSVVTHSPYLIRKYNHDHHLLNVVHAANADVRFNPSDILGLSAKGRPTWGEINYTAFQVYSVEFHNELFGMITAHIERGKGDGKHATELEIDRFLEQEGCLKNKEWSRSNGHTHPCTLPVYVRNCIHHPENSLNDAFSAAELEESTELLLKVASTLSLC